ncbi:MAG: putative metal-dependent hydrolase [Spirosomataceae bacterium]
MQSLSYPIGTFNYTGPYTTEVRAQLIAEIESLPQRLREAVASLEPYQLDTPYRPEGWTVRQLLHHVPDSHANGYIRTKLTLTEDTPTIKPYLEDAWAHLPDTELVPVETSLTMLEVIHERWVAIWKSMKPEQFERRYFHPESKDYVSLDTQLGLYAWHSNHHLAHVTELNKRMGWL